MCYYAYDIQAIRNIINSPGTSKKEAFSYLEEIKRQDDQLKKMKNNIIQIKNKYIRVNLLTDNPIPITWQNNVDFNMKYMKDIVNETGYKNLILGYSHNLNYKDKLKEDIISKVVKINSSKEKANPSVLTKKMKLFEVSIDKNKGRIKWESKEDGYKRFISNDRRFNKNDDSLLIDDEEMQDMDMKSDYEFSGNNFISNEGKLLYNLYLLTLFYLFIYTISIFIMRMIINIYILYLRSCN